MDSAAGVHSAVTSLIAAFVLNNLSGHTVLAWEICFPVSIQDHQHADCVRVPSLEHTGCVEHPEKDMRSQEYCLNSFFLPPAHHRGFVISFSSSEI